MDIKMLTQLETRVNELPDSFNKEIANENKKQSESKNNSNEKYTRGNQQTD